MRSGLIVFSACLCQGFRHCHDFDRHVSEVSTLDHADGIAVPFERVPAQSML